MIKLIKTSGRKKEAVFSLPGVLFLSLPITCLFYQLRRERKRWVNKERKRAKCG